MGISTLQSYRGAQIFEAIGLNREVIDKYFTWTASRVGGVGLEAIAREIRAIAIGWPFMPIRTSMASSTRAASISGGGAASIHMYNPNTIAKLQHAVRSGNYRLFKEYTRLVDEHSRSLATLRGLLKFKSESRRRCRSKKSSRPAKSSSASRPARCRSDRSARKRTRISRSR